MLSLLMKRDRRIVITLWEERAIQFRDSVVAASNGRAAFVVIIGILEKKYSLANVILSSGDGTATYCNIDYAPLNDLRASVLTATGHTIDSMPPPTTARLMAATTDATMEKTIQEILESEAPKEDEVIRVLCEATIVAISKYDDWFYNSCLNCPCGIQFDSDKLSCRLCPGPIDKYRQRYMMSDLCAYINNNVLTCVTNL
ncbi:hypothetical protein POM88_044693 [Heracleum sosnowskyi]|uniref:Replication factor A C-terminal domain-containing protein n=1 Tax=Heracleum sosnowskyi TaxID=360622 RepID=A0AAD8H4D2_9APIA|nr:hypothetical protein POM88_044693 [Heracleum sosnowskyi]